MFSCYTPSFGTLSQTKAVAANLGFALLLALLPVHSALAQAFTRVISSPATDGGANTSGVCWGDYDNDGDDDLFVANLSGQRNALYHNDAGRFVDAAGEFAAGGDSYSCSWGDYDNDGYLDLFVANLNGANELYQNNQGRLERVDSGPVVRDGGRSRDGAWGDYDGDGLLDLFVTNAAGQVNFLYHNNGTGAFTRATSNPVTSDVANAAGAAWADYDNDGDLDLFVANNGGRDALYRNNGDGTFESVTDDPLVDTEAYSQGGSWGDYDNDGDLDLFVTSGKFSQPLEVNFLYRNNGDGTFNGVPESTFSSENGYAVGSAWGDYDNDGDLDLFVAYIDQGNLLYANDGTGSLMRVSESTVVQDGGDSFGAGWADYDSDGDLDLFVANWEGQPNFLYANNGNSKRWISLRLVGTVSNRAAVGAKVRLKAEVFGEATWQLREVSTQTGRNGQNSLNLAFGLGEATRIDSIQIEWPSGIVQTLTDVAADQYLTVTERAAQVQFIHNALDLAADPVDVYVNGTLAADDLAFRTATSFVLIGTGEVRIDFAPGNSTSAADAFKRFSVAFEADQSYVIVADGLGDRSTQADDAFTLFTYDQAKQTASKPDHVDLLLHHGSPDAPAFNLDVLDALYGGSRTSLVEGWGYGAFQGYASVDAGTYPVEVRLRSDGSLFALYNAGLEAVAGEAVTLLASGLVDTDDPSRSFALLLALPEGGPLIPLTLINIVGTEQESATLPSRLVVRKSYPNPSRTAARIYFDLPRAAKVSLSVFDVLGRQVLALPSQSLPSGTGHFLRVEASGLPSGTYFYRVTAQTSTGTEVDTGRLTVVK